MDEPRTERRRVLDTNTLVSRLLVPGGAAGQAVDCALARGVLLVSVETLDELTEVLGRTKFDRYVPIGDRRHFLGLLGGVARIVNITHRVTACRDRRDAKFLHVALNGEAEAIITGDADLLALHPFRGVAIITPRDFVSIS